MYCWGKTINGELGLGGIEDEYIKTPLSVPFNDVEHVKQVACGLQHTLVLLNDGRVFSCGNNNHGQLGHSMRSNRKLQLVEGLSAFFTTAVSCGVSHSLAVNEWGQLYIWGSIAQDCHWSTAKIETPRLVKQLAGSQVVQIASGCNHNVVLTNSGELFAWGSNAYGQLGIGEDNQIFVHSPTKIKGLTGIPISMIACGGNHTFAVSKSGSIFCWGRNTTGQLGLNDHLNRYVPCELETMRSLKVTYVQCGEDFSIFLTKDGGVFSCGAGTYGQLGHGGSQQKAVPCKIWELMGSIVTQIACGRRHTLAYVPASNRIYGFGSNLCSQLGNLDNLVSVPREIGGPWSPLPPDAMETDVDVRVKQIFAGGDQSFVTMTESEVCTDLRVMPECTQVLTINEHKLSLMASVQHNESVDQDTLSYIELVFPNQSCWNASFLLPNDRHFGCEQHNIGVDIPAAIAAFHVLSDCKNNTIKEVIYNNVVDTLLPGLQANPPDMEALRIFILLPMYGEFNNPVNYKKLQCVFAKAYLQLAEAHKKIVGKWWCSDPIVIVKLIAIFHNVLFLILCQPHAGQQSLTLEEHDTSGGYLRAALNILRDLNYFNHVNGYKVPKSAFHLKSVSLLVDVRDDYIKFLKEMQLGVESTHESDLYLCNYSFLYDSKAKAVLLQTEHTMQMSIAIPVTRGFRTVHFDVTNLHLPVRLEVQRGIEYLSLAIHRSTLVQNAIDDLSGLGARNLKRPLKVEFVGEEAEDAGGVTREFVFLLLQGVLNPNYGMFKVFPETNLLWFSEESFETDTMFYILGILLGLAVYNNIVVDTPFPQALYKKLLNEELTLEDVRSLSPTIANSLQSILDYTDNDMEEVFNLSFEMSRLVFGELKTHELKPGGAKIPVTQKNKDQYVELYVIAFFDHGVVRYSTAFRDGFLKVCGGRIMKLFHSSELMELLNGSEDYDWKILEDCTTYNGGYSSNDPTIRLFWEMFRELALEHKKMFLMFLTGCDRVPILGMKSINIQIQPVNDDRFLPVAHTCFNLLDLPRYRTIEKMRYKFMQAIHQTFGFSLV